jgi:hypothetical protein
MTLPFGKRSQRRTGGVLPNGADAKGWLARPPVRIMTRVLTDFFAAAL